MSLSKKFLTLAAPAALLALSACATGFPAQVSRFQAMPAPQGETFIIRPADSEDRGGLEFSRYADLVSRHMIAQGYRQAGPGEGASMIVELDYGVDNGRERVVTEPGFGRPFGFHPYYSRFGYFGHPRAPFYYGWYDPFWSPFGYPEVHSYTVYTSYLDMEIERPSGESLFEGTAQARSRTNRLTSLVPNLVEAMFTNFPGQSGETVRITVDDSRR